MANSQGLGTEPGGWTWDLESAWLNDPLELDTHEYCPEIYHLRGFENDTFEYPDLGQCQDPISPRTPRLKITETQERLLMDWVDRSPEPYPTKEEKVNLASLTDMSVGQLDSWFSRLRQRKLQRVEPPASTDPTFQTVVQQPAERGNHTRFLDQIGGSGPHFRQPCESPRSVYLHDRDKIDSIDELYTDSRPFLRAGSLDTNLGCTSADGRIPSPRALSLPLEFGLGHTRCLSSRGLVRHDSALSLEALASLDGASWSLSNAEEIAKQDLPLLARGIPVEPRPKAGCVESWLEGLGVSEQCLSDHNTDPPSCRSFAPVTDDAQHASFSSPSLAALATVSNHVPKARSSSDNGSSNGSAASASSYLSFGPRKGRRLAFKSPTMFDRNNWDATSGDAALDRRPKSPLLFVDMRKSRPERERLPDPLWPQRPSHSTRPDHEAPSGDDEQPCAKRQKQTATKFACTFCQRPYSNRFTWERHEKSAHVAGDLWICGDTLSRETSQDCPICATGGIRRAIGECGHRFPECLRRPRGARTFYRRDALKQHLKVFHCKNQSWPEQTVPLHLDGWRARSSPAATSLVCHFCCYQPRNWEARVQHLTSHFEIGMDLSQWKASSPNTLARPPGGRYLSHEYPANGFLANASLRETVTRLPETNGMKRIDANVCTHCRRLGIDCSGHGDPLVQKCASCVQRNLECDSKNKPRHHAYSSLAYSYTVCPLCNLIFWEKAKLRHHCRALHTVAIIQHMQDHPGKMLRCPFCREEGAPNINLDPASVYCHMTEHPSPGVDGTRCPLCLCSATWAEFNRHVMECITGMFVAQAEEWGCHAFYI